MHTCTETQSHNHNVAHTSILTDNRSAFTFKYTTMNKPGANEPWHHKLPLTEAPCLPPKQLSQCNSSSMRVTHSRLSSMSRTFTPLEYESHTFTLLEYESRTFTPLEYESRTFTPLKYESHTFTPILIRTAFILEREREQRDRAQREEHLTAWTTSTLIHGPTKHRPTNPQSEPLQSRSLQGETLQHEIYKVNR